MDEIEKFYGGINPERLKSMYRLLFGDFMDEAKLLLAEHDKNKMWTDLTELSCVQSIKEIGERASLILEKLVDYGHEPGEDVDELLATLEEVSKMEENMWHKKMFIDDDWVKKSEDNSYNTICLKCESRYKYFTESLFPKISKYQDKEYLSEEMRQELKAAVDFGMDALHFFRELARREGRDRLEFDELKEKIFMLNGIQNYFENKRKKW